MVRRVLSLLLFLPLFASAQPTTTQLLRAFPITDYIMDLNDSTKLVQVHLEQAGLIKDKQLGILKTLYRTTGDKPVEIGYGRCNLIKGDYYYFTIGNNKTSIAAKEGDLLYLAFPKPDLTESQLIKIAAHYIGLRDVYDTLFYDRYEIFNTWTEKNEKAALDSMVKDIRFTGDYFLKNDPSMNIAIKTGPYKGKLVLDVMMTATVKDLKDFFGYIIARPGLYAGNQWKVSEIFATWLSEGAPMAVTSNNN